MKMMIMNMMMTETPMNITEKLNTCVKYLKASTTGVIISLYASICVSQMQENIILSKVKNEKAS